MVSPVTSDSIGDRSDAIEPDALAGSPAEHVGPQRGELARVDRLARITKQIAHLIKASDRLAEAPLPDHVALPAMDRINYEIEILTYEQRSLQLEEDLSLVDALEMADRRASLVHSVLQLPDAAIPEAMWTLYDEVDGDEVAFADALGLEPSNPDAQLLFGIVSTTIGDRP